MQVYSKDGQATQVQQEHVASLKAAGFIVEWVPREAKLLQLVDVASHYIAHPMSPEGAFFAIQVCASLELAAAVAVHVPVLGAQAGACLG